MPVPVPTEATHLSSEVIGVLSALGASALTALGAFIKSRQQAKKDATTVDLDRDKLRYEVMQREHTDTRQLSDQFRSLMQAELSRLRIRTEEQEREIEELQALRRKLLDQNSLLETESRVLEVRRQALITQYELELDNLRTALFHQPTVPAPQGHSQPALPAHSNSPPPAFFVGPPPTNPQLLALGGTDHMPLTLVHGASGQWPTQAVTTSTNTEDADNKATTNKTQGDDDG